jgi:predicted HicB family RNase H-like nuclease
MLAEVTAIIMIAGESTMKRIVNGLAYDTVTSDPIARAEYEIEDGGIECTCYGTLYRTPGGAFFEHREIVVGDDDGGTTKHRFEPMSAAAAQKWVHEGDVELIDNTFINPPEATAETEATATIYLRVPASLKRRVDEAAMGAGLSINAYMLRCTETCLGTPLRVEKASQPFNLA